MKKLVDYQSLLHSLDILQYLYDIIRIVDPLTKKVVDCYDNYGITKGITCFAFWRRNLICENCISARAYQTKETIMKIEYNGEKLFFVTATPINTSNGIMVLELLKDITQTGIIDNITSRDIATLYNLVDQTNQQVLTDSLTGLYNRRYIDSHLPVDLTSTRLKKEPLAIIMADIDYFKKINDQYGHIGGDYVLKAVAEELQRHRSNLDWTARYGGEEFLICLKNMPAAAAFQIAERFRKNIENLNIVYDDYTIKCTISFGICTHIDHMSAEDVIHCADQKLYEAKKAGRNRVMA